MKVAILGNMNNFGNNLAAYLLDEGVDVDLLFYSNEAAHFTPSADNIQPPRYRSKQLSWGSYSSYFFTSAKTIRDDLEPYDFLIGSRLAPSFCVKAGRHLDIFMPTGGDLHTVPVWNGWKPRDVIKYVGFAKRQREAIKRVGALYWDETNDELEKTIAPYTQSIERMVHGLPLIYIPEYQGELLEKRKEQSQWTEKFKQARSGADIFLFSHLKHVWTEASILEYGRFHDKGTDTIVRGLAKYYQSDPKKTIRLAMFEYGRDHKATRQLAIELGVNQYISWFPQLPRREIMLGIDLADAVIGQTARSWFSYGTIFEAMVMQKPVLHHRNDSLYTRESLYPMVNVYDEDSMSQAFHDIADKKIDLVKMGRSAYEWLLKYSVRSSIQDIVKRIDRKRALCASADSDAK